MTNTELIQKIKAEIERRITDNTFGAKLELIDILAWLDTLGSEKPVPNDLEEAANKFAISYDQGTCDGIAKDCFKAGAEWQKEQDEKEQADLFTIVALDAAQRAKIKIMEDFPKWRKIKAGERLPCPAYVWTIAYDNYPDCFEGRLMPNIQGVKVGRDTWYLPVDVIHNLPKED